MPIRTHHNHIAHSPATSPAEEPPAAEPPDAEPPDEEPPASVPPVDAPDAAASSASDVPPVNDEGPQYSAADIDLVLVKTASDTSVDSGRGDLIDYTLTVTNVGLDPVLAPMVADLLPEGATLSGIVDVATVPEGNEVGWTIDDSVPGEITASYDSLFYPGDMATFTFQRLVGELAQPDPAVAVPDIVNDACVAGFRYANDMGAE